jgi:hypothetical protein
MSKKSNKKQLPKSRDLFQVWAWKRFANAAYTQGNKKAAISRRACRGKVEH